MSHSITPYKLETWRLAMLLFVWILRGPRDFEGGGRSASRGNGKDRGSENENEKTIQEVTSQREMNRDDVECLAV